MTDSTPAAAPSRSSPPYSDTQAMDDIQALLTSPTRSRGEDAVDELAEIVQRTGRSMAMPRLIRVRQITGEDGLPQVLIVAGDTHIDAWQDPGTDAIGISVLTTSRHDQQHLRIEVNGQEVVPGHRDAEGPDSEGPVQLPAEGSAR
jgi:hypothetical protein